LDSTTAGKVTRFFRTWIRRWARTVGPASSRCSKARPGQQLLRIRLQIGCYELKETSLVLWMGLCNVCFGSSKRAGTLMNSWCRIKHDSIYLQGTRYLSVLLAKRYAESHFCWFNNFSHAPKCSQWTQ